MLAEKDINRLRCPDCGGRKLAFEPTPKQDRQPSVHCRDCRRIIDQRNGILLAHPSTLSVDSDANLAHYDEMAAEMDSHLAQRARSRNFQQKADMVTQALRLDEEPGREILELGTGAGALGALVAAAGHRYTGVDISAGFLDMAQKTYPTLAEHVLIAAEAANIPFQDGSYDGVFCVGTLHHLTAPLEGVREMLRLLHTGGRFCFIEPKWYHPGHFIGYLRNPSVEVGTLRTRQHEISHYLRSIQAQEVQARHFVFTPNGPAPLHPPLRFADRLLERLKPLNLASIMFCVYGVK